MANLPETPVWETGIYQLEETDPVQGGLNGIDNQQGKQLANRTAWLKSQVETLGTGKQPLDATLTAIAALNGVADRIAYFTGPDTVALTPLTAFIRTLLDDGDASAARSTLGAISQTQLDAAISALVNSSPTTLDTLNELAAALGNDANFATTVTNALAAKAPIASPVFTGDPKAPTPAQFDNDTSLATTEFVQRALGNMAGFEIFTASKVLNAASAGKYLVFSSSSSLTCTLPNPSGLPVGTRIYVESSGGGSLAVSASGGADFAGPNAGSSPLSTVTLRSGVSAEFIVQSATRYRFVGGSGEAFLASSGYQKLPSGLIMQWGSVIPSAAGVSVTFPVAFPSACQSLLISSVNSAVTSSIPLATSVPTTSGFTAYSVSGAPGGRWIAIGY